MMYSFYYHESRTVYVLSRTVQNCHGKLCQTHMFFCFVLFLFLLIVCFSILWTLTSYLTDIFDAQSELSLCEVYLSGGI